jgi:hypothetical protein
MNTDQRREMFVTKHGEREEIRVESDGRTVWVNAPQGCIARFGPFGVDYQAALLKMAYWNGTPNLVDWEIFVNKIKGISPIGSPIEVGNQHRPLYIS